MFDLLVTFVCLFVRPELLPVDFASKLDSLLLPTGVNIIIPSEMEVAPHPQNN